MNLFEIIAAMERLFEWKPEEVDRDWANAKGNAKTDLVALMGETNAKEIVSLVKSCEGNPMASALGTVSVHEAQQQSIVAAALAYARGKADGLSQAYPERG
jgi:hypothetical protein